MLGFGIVTLSVMLTALLDVPVKLSTATTLPEYVPAVLELPIESTCELGTLTLILPLLSAVVLEVATTLPLLFNTSIDTLPLAVKLLPVTVKLLGLRLVIISPKKHKRM